MYESHDGVTSSHIKYVPSIDKKDAFKGYSEYLLKVMCRELSSNFFRYDR